MEIEYGGGDDESREDDWETKVSFVLATSCYGYNQRQFPAGNLFGAANDAIWDNQAACGRKYRIRCLSGTSNERVNPCRKRSLVVKILDYCSSAGCDNGDATLHLSADAFSHIAHSSAKKINVEYEQV
ncbi:hypothetical protein SUGI_0218640 [Cryptomeria japonica]|nr:hypothetical protein SUGI_0218640 [Cryptomeria japonica]